MKYRLIGVAFVAAAILAACGARDTGNVPPISSPTTGLAPLVTTAIASPTPFPNNYVIGSGEIFGVDNLFSPNDGDTSTGGQGQTITSHNGQLIACNQNSIHYHIHAFMGIIVNGRQYAIPDGVGMKNPGADVYGTPFAHGYWTSTASCFYYIHMHDASGVIHVESTSTAANTTTVYTLGDVFKVWGRQLSSTRVGPFSGTLHVYVAKVPFETDNIARSAYTLYTGDPSNIPLYSHTAIWLEVGSPYYTPAQFPVLVFYEST
jgi:hypothetical protein